MYLKHGLSRHPLYPAWYHMLQRCENPRDSQYRNYGGRGIGVCERWHDIRLFTADIERLIGPRPAGHSLDRYPDNDGDYVEGNVRWATPSEQWHNSRKCLLRNLLIWDGTVHQADTDEERWLPVPGFAGWYEASCCGNVSSLARAATAGGLLIPQLNSAGYRTVRLCRYGRVETVTVGSIVLMTFRGPANGRRARHGPGGKTDDSLPNLRWG